MTRKEQAVEYHHSAFNCAQAVACSFCDVTKKSMEDTYKFTEAFGLGLGGMRTCGAVSAMAIVVGLLNSDGDYNHPGQTKLDTYKKIAPLVSKFEKEVGTLVCKDIRGVGKESPIMECDDCIRIAVEILENYLNSQSEK